MAYASNDEASQFEVYVRAVQGLGRRIRVSTQGGTHPKWNPNGKELFYRTGNYDVSPDGKRFGMVKDDSASGRWNIVLNWTEELKARVPLK